MKRIEDAVQEVDRLRAEMTERKARVRHAKSEARRADHAAEVARKAAGREEAELERLAPRLEAAQDALRRARTGESTGSRKPGGTG